MNGRASGEDQPCVFRDTSSNSHEDNYDQVPASFDAHDYETPIIISDSTQRESIHSSNASVTAEENPVMSPPSPSQWLRRRCSSTSCQSIRLLGLDPAAPSGQTHLRPPDIAANLIILVDAPKGATLGCDILKPRFNPHRHALFNHACHSLHFAWVAPGDASHGRIGFFFFNQPTRNGSTKVLQWNPYNNTLGPYAIRSLEGSLIDAVHSRMSGGASRRLTREDWEKVPVWTAMTSSLTRATLANIVSVSEDNWRVSSSDPIRDPAHPDLDLYGGLERHRASPYVQELSFRFAKMICAAYDKISMPSSDTTAVLQEYMEAHPELRTTDLIAEMQFLFIAGAIADNKPCFDLWVKMAKAVVLHSFRLPETFPCLAGSLFTTLAAQLAYHDYVDGERFGRLTSISEGLREAICVYKMRLADLCLLPGCQSEKHKFLARAFSQVENWFGSRFGDDMRGHYVKKQNLDGVSHARRAVSCGPLFATVSTRDSDEEMVPFPVQTPVVKEEEKKKSRFRRFFSKWR